MIKRAFDLVFAAGFLLLLSPLILVISIALAISIGAPIFFIQDRPGLHGKPFRMIKFRTMSNARGLDGNLLPDGERMTRLGALLRKTSLDELPELWNVLRGDMSLVGPRPLLMDYLPLFSQNQNRRHEVRPGITGLAQVNGRNSLPWERRFELDVWYVDHRNFWLDVVILFKTVKKVIKRDGISADGEATMSKFKGSQE